MRFLKLGGLLFVFWLMLSGHTGPLLLSLGLVSVILVVWLVGRMDRVDRAPATMIFTLEFLRYLVWLAYQILLSNIDVAKRIWDPDLPISPTWRRIKVDVSQPFTKTLYANSITLTPGTVTTEVGDDFFVVHGLDKQAVEDLVAGEMETRIARLEQAP